MSKKEKLKGIAIIAIFVAFSIIFGKESLAANFIVRNVSNTNQIYFIVNGTTGYVGIGTGVPNYPLHVVGDVYWTGTLQGGIVPWARLQGYNLDVAWSGKLGWGNLTGYNLNVPWTGLLGWGNLTGYDLNVNWIGKLGWGNLTGYPSINPGPGLTGGGDLSTSRSLSIAFGEDFLGWRNLTNYPAGCGPGQAVQAIGDTLSCINLNSTGNVTGIGTTNALTYWTSSNTIGALGFGTAGQFLKSQGSGNLPIWSSIYLGTDTEGNYVAGLTAGTGIVVSGTPVEGWSPTVSINTTMIPRKDVADTINAPWTFAENVWFNKNVFIAGNLSYVNVQTLNVNGSLIPIFSGQFDVGNSTYKWRNVTAVNIVGDNVYGGTVYSGGNAVLTTATIFSNATGSDISVSGNYNSLNLQINAGAVGTNEIADNAVTTAKIADKNVTLAKLNQTSCSAGQALQSIGGGSYACVDVNPTGTITGSGSIGYIPLWNGTYSLNNSLISQSGGNIVINSGNLNIQSGGLLIGGTTVIDSSRNLVGINQVNQNLNFGSSYSIYNANWINGTNLYASQGIYSTNGYYVGNNQVITSGRVIQAADGGASSPAFTFSSETNTGMYRAGSGIIGFSTGGTQRATISSSGLNIASGGLLIGGSTVIDSSRNANFASLQIGGTNIIDSNRNIVNVNWVNATNLNISGTAMVNNLLIYTRTNCEKLYTDSSGNVLCGSDQGITQETDPLWSGNISAITANYVIKRNSTGITASSIYDNGNVGIGTTNPLNKLEVVGTTNITSAGTTFYVDTNGNVWVKL